MKNSLSSLFACFHIEYLMPCYSQTVDRVPPGTNGLPGTATMLESNTNAPEAVNAPASNLPHEVAPRSIVILVSASMLPWNSVPVPSVAELPTCHQTLEALAPPVRRIRVPAIVVSVPCVWKTNTASALPPALSVRSPCI